MLDSVAQRFGFSFEQMQNQLDSAQNDAAGPAIEQQLNLEEKALALLIQNPQLAETVAPGVSVTVPLLEELIQACQKGHFKNTGQAIEYFREEDLSIKGGARARYW